MVVAKRASPCMVALRNKYKVKDEWLNKEPPKNGSQTWIKKGACFLVGDGSSIDVRKELWVPWLLEFIPKPKPEVANLIDPVTRDWNTTYITK